MANTYRRSVNIFSPEGRHPHDLTKLAILASQNNLGCEVISQERARNWQNWGRFTLYSVVQISGAQPRVDYFVDNLYFR